MTPNSKTTGSDTPDTPRPLRILLVDDHPIYREGVARTLVDLGGMDIATGEQLWKVPYAKESGGVAFYSTGFLVSAQGHIVTVWSHVLDDQGVSVILYDGRKFDNFRPRPGNDENSFQK